MKWYKHILVNVLMTDLHRPRVRYAPSPTGFPHVGNIHTALFNWIFARHAGGSFILRIEDTDQDRVVPGSLEAIYESLRWLGLQWDEGPEVGGSFGPYFQSERLPIYRSYAEQLVASGHAYHCFCTLERLAEVRAAQEARKEPPRYDRFCRNLSPTESERRLKAGEPSVIRLAVPETGETSFHDLFRGEITFQNALIDDQVLIKSDGWPTYHLANVVDDHLMEITHVLRGDEWISSTPKHVLLYQFLGWKPPLFGHFPILLTMNRAKLSKRRGAPDILELRAKGYLPEAVVNFLALLGWAPEGKTEVLSCDELIQQFTLERVGATPAIYNPEKLDWMNGYYIRQLAPDDLARRLVPIYQEAGLIPGNPVPSETLALITRLVPLIQERIKTLGDAPALTDFFFRDDLVYDPASLMPKGWTREQTLDALRQARDRLVQCTRPPERFEAERLDAALRVLADEMQVKTGQLFGALRVALTARTVAPPLFQTMEVLGPERTLDRIDRAINLLASGTAVVS
jgi:glutamyl-tRNA synthetase